MDLASWLTNFANLLIKHYDLDGVMDVIYTSRRELASCSCRTEPSKTRIFLLMMNKLTTYFSSFEKVSAN